MTSNDVSRSLSLFLTPSGRESARWPNNNSPAAAAAAAVAGCLRLRRFRREGAPQLCVWILIPVVSGGGIGVTIRPLLAGKEIIEGYGIIEKSNNLKPQTSRFFIILFLTSVAASHQHLDER